MNPQDVFTALSGAGNHLFCDAPLSDEEGFIVMVDTLTHGDEESPDLKLMEQSLRDEINMEWQLFAPREIQICRLILASTRLNHFNLEEVGENAWPHKRKGSGKQRTEP